MTLFYCQHSISVFEISDNISYIHSGGQVDNRSNAAHSTLWSWVRDVRLTHAELVNRAAAKSWTTGDTDTAHVDGRAGLHDDDILILGFLRIAITVQLFRSNVFFFFLFLI